MNVLAGRPGRSEPAGLEQRYRRLLACYPRAYRRENGEEILAVLLASARDGQAESGPGRVSGPDQGRAADAAMTDAAGAAHCAGRDRASVRRRGGAACLPDHQRRDARHRRLGLSPQVPAVGGRGSAPGRDRPGGEAGAINELGRGTWLPTAVSRQNSEWWWGPGNPHATTIVAVASAPDGGGTGYAPTLASSSPTCGWRPLCRIRTASGTRTGAAISLSAPALASRGARCGYCCANTTDGRPPDSPNPAPGAGYAGLPWSAGLACGPDPIS